MFNTDLKLYPRKHIHVNEPLMGSMVKKECGISFYGSGNFPVHAAIFEDAIIALGIFIVSLLFVWCRIRIRIILSGRIRIQLISTWIRKPAI